MIPALKNHPFAFWDESEFCLLGIDTQICFVVCSEYRLEDPEKIFFRGRRKVGGIRKSGVANTTAKGSDRGTYLTKMKYSSPYWMFVQDLTELNNRLGRIFQHSLQRTCEIPVENRINNQATLCEDTKDDTERRKEPGSCGILLECNTQQYDGCNSDNAEGSSLDFEVSTQQERTISTTSFDNSSK